MEITDTAEARDSQIPGGEAAALEQGTPPGGGHKLAGGVVDGVNVKIPKYTFDDSVLFTSICW